MKYTRKNELTVIRDLHWDWNFYLKQLEEMPPSEDICRKMEWARKHIARLQARAAEINTVNAHWMVQQ